ncbi:MAG: nitroreductase family protein [Mogibacterium sp.]|nr:nitroreductase family protein [Mogibacterium sp.]
MRYYDEIVKNRQSCRSFEDKEVEAEKIADIIAYHEDEESDLVDELETELKFYDSSAYDRFKDSVGYSGVCIKAPHYAVLYSEKGEHYLENAGYIIQGITLKLTELGLAACWLTINDAAAAKTALAADTEKELACVLAFGYRATDNDEKKAPKLSLDELCMGADFETEVDTDLFYPELEYCLRACAHSQSFQNLQPYRMLVDATSVYLVGLPSDMTNEYDRRLNYGILMFNFYSVMWDVRPQAPRWSFEAPERDLKLPEGVTYIAKCKI